MPTRATGPGVPLSGRAMAGEGTEPAPLARTVLDALPDAIALLDGAGRYLVANRAECERLGRTEDALRGAVADDRDAEAEYCTRSEVALPDGLGVGRLVVRHAASRRAEAERELERVKAILETAIEQIPVPIALVSCPDSIILYANRACAEFLDVGDRGSSIGSPLHAVRRTWQDYDPNGQPVPFTEMPLMRAMRGEVTSPTVYEVRTDRGSQRWELATGTPIYGADGAQIAAMVVFVDITDHMRTENALRESQERYRRIVELSHEGVWTMDADCATSLVNPRMAAMLGCTPSSMVGRCVTDFLFPEDLDDHEARMVERRSGLRGQYERRFRRVDGGELWAEVSAVPVWGPSGEYQGSFSMVRDITERKRAAAERARLEQELAEARKLESIGQLAGGVAHDFNNMLMPVLGYAEILRSTAAEGSPQREALDYIIAAAERARDLTRQLLAFARRQTLALRPLDLNEVIRGIADILRRMIREDIAIVTDLAPRGCVVLGDAGQLEQVILNLAINAQDAMPQGGTLTVATVRTTAEARDAEEPNGAQPACSVAMTVTDTGFGMDRAVAERIFEPFFTTKEMGRGTGLGLATVYGIVRQHEGHIAVESEPGSGTRFTVRLPLVNAPAARHGRAGPNAEPVAGSGTVLLVEDQQMVRGVTRSLLEQCGYTVIEAADAESALAASAATTEPISLLVTDVVMTGMDGRTLHERLEHERPGLPALFMSGYPSTVIGHHGVLDPGVHFLQKPFSLADLAAAVRDALG